MSRNRTDLLSIDLLQSLGPVPAAPRGLSVAAVTKRANGSPASCSAAEMQGRFGAVTACSDAVGWRSA
jgi:hypothetical protein